MTPTVLGMVTIHGMVDIRGMVTIIGMVTIPGMVAVLKVLIIIEYVRLCCMTLHNLILCWYFKKKPLYKLTGTYRQTDRRTDLDIGRHTPSKDS